MCWPRGGFESEYPQPTGPAAGGDEGAASRPVRRRRWTTAVVACRRGPGLDHTRTVESHVSLGDAALGWTPAAGVPWGLAPDAASQATHRSPRMAQCTLDRSGCGRELFRDQ